MGLWPGGRESGGVLNGVTIGGVAPPGRTSHEMHFSLLYPRRLEWGTSGASKGRVIIRLLAHIRYCLIVYRKVNGLSIGPMLNLFGG